MLNILLLKNLITAENFSEKTVTPNPVLTSNKMWMSICLRNDLTLGKLK